MMRRILFMAGLLALFSINQAVFAPPAYPETSREGQDQAVNPGDHFRKAQESFLGKDMKASAAEIRKGADILRKEADSAHAKEKRMLAASVKELDKLADSVEKGAVKTDRKLKDAFSRAEQAVARNDYVKATDSWARKETKETGHALDAAAEHVEQAADWSGRKLKAGASRAVEEGRAVSAKLVEGTGYVKEEVGKALKSMGDAISGLGREIRPHP